MSRASSSRTGRLAATSELLHRLRAAEGQPDGALVLFHGRGANELDLVPLLDFFDPERRLVGITPRGPLALPPGGAHWYVVEEIGYPDPETFHATFDLAAAWLDGIAASTGIAADRTILGGFSQGAVMSYSLGLGAGRPRPAGILALSGFIPTVPGFELDLASEPRPPVAIGHGTYDPVIEVAWGRRARAQLEAAGFQVTYRESSLPHAIDPGFLADLRPWIASALPASTRVEAPPGKRAGGSR